MGHEPLESPLFAISTLNSFGMGLEVTARAGAGLSWVWPGEDGRELDEGDDEDEECRFEEEIVGMRGDVDTARV